MYNGNIQLNFKTIPAMQDDIESERSKLLLVVFSMGSLSCALTIFWLHFRIVLGLRKSTSVFGRSNLLGHKHMLDVGVINLKSFILWLLCLKLLISQRAVNVLGVRQLKTTVSYIQCYGIPFVETLFRHEMVILFIDTWDAWNHPTILCATSWMIS